MNVFYMTSTIFYPTGRCILWHHHRSSPVVMVNLNSSASGTVTTVGVWQAGCPRSLADDEITRPLPLGSRYTTTMINQLINGRSSISPYQPRSTPQYLWPLHHTVDHRNITMLKSFSPTSPATVVIKRHIVKTAKNTLQSGRFNFQDTYWRTNLLDTRT